MTRTLFRTLAFGLLLSSSACLVTTTSGRPPGGGPAPAPQPTPPPPPASLNGAITGMVIDAATKQPIDRAGIELNSGAGPGTGKNAQTDATGMFQMPELKPGSYGIRCSREGYQTFEQMIEVRAGETAQVSCALRKR